MEICWGSKESDVGEVQSDDGFTRGFLLFVKDDLRLSRANITFYVDFGCSPLYIFHLQVWNTLFLKIHSFVFLNVVASYVRWAPQSWSWLRFVYWAYKGPVIMLEQPMKSTHPHSLRLESSNLFLWVWNLALSSQEKFVEHLEGSTFPNTTRNIPQESGTGGFKTKTKN